MFYIKRNLPMWERALRVVMGLTLAGLAFSQPLAAAAYWLVLASAATMALTAVAGFCPACALLGRRALAEKK